MTLLAACSPESSIKHTDSADGMDINVSKETTGVVLDDAKTVSEGDGQIKAYPALARGNGKLVIAHDMTAFNLGNIMPDRPLNTWVHSYEMAAEQGINVLSVHMEPSASGEVNRLIESSQIAAAIPNFSIAICISLPRSSLMKTWYPVVVKWCEAARGNEGIEQIDGRPVIWTYHAGAQSLDDWRAFIDTLHKAGYNPYFVGDMFAFAFSKPKQFKEQIGEWGEVMDSLYMFGSEITDERFEAMLAVSDKRVASIGGGYWRWGNDKQGNSQLYQGSKKLENSWSFAMESNPDWVHLTTWNDFLEHTSFMPSRNRGDLYQELTKQYAAALKSIPRVGEEKYWLTAPAEILNGPGGVNEHVYELRGQDIPVGETRTFTLRVLNDNGQVIREESGEMSDEQPRFAFDWEPQNGEFGESRYLWIEVSVARKGGEALVASLPVLIWPEGVERTLYKSPRSLRLLPEDQVPSAPRMAITEENTFVVEDIPSVDDPDKRVDVLYNMYMKGADGVNLGVAYRGEAQLPEGGVFDPYYFQPGFRQAATITRDGRVAWAKPLCMDQAQAYSIERPSFVLEDALPKTNDVIQINFQPSGTSYQDFLVDQGKVLDNRGNGYTYGWSRDVTNFARMRNLSDNYLYDTSVLGNYYLSNWFWEIVLENGHYAVELIVGDVAFGKYPPTDKRLVVEGQELDLSKADYVPKGIYIVRTEVVLRDNLLTVECEGGINAIRITPVK